MFHFFTVTSKINSISMINLNNPTSHGRQPVVAKTLEEKLFLFRKPIPNRDVREFYEAVTLGIGRAIEEFACDRPSDPLLYLLETAEEALKNTDVSAAAQEKPED